MHRCNEVHLQGIETIVPDLALISRMENKRSANFTLYKNVYRFWFASFIFYDYHKLFFTGSWCNILRIHFDNSCISCTSLTFVNFFLFGTVCDEISGSSYHLFSKVNLGQLCPEETCVNFDTTFTIFTNDSEELSKTTVSPEEAEPVVFLPTRKTKQLAANNCWTR